MASPHSAEALVHSMGLRQIYPSGYRRGCCLPAVGRAVLWFLREELAPTRNKKASSLARLPSVKEVSTPCRSAASRPGRLAEQSHEVQGRGQRRLALTDCLGGWATRSLVTQTVVIISLTMTCWCCPCRSDGTSGPSSPSCSPRRASRRSRPRSRTRP